MAVEKTELAINPHITHPMKEDPMKEDVKNKHSPTSFPGEPWVVTCIQARFLSRRGLWFSALDRRVERRCQSQLSDLMVFMSRWCSMRFGSEATQANRWLKCQPSSYVRLEAYGFFGLSEGA